MPKLAPTESQIQNRMTRAAIAHGQEQWNISDEQLAKKVGCSLRTIQRRKDDPSGFTLEELRRVAKVLHMNYFQQVEMIGVMKVQ